MVRVRCGGWAIASLAAVVLLGSCIPGGEAAPAASLRVPAEAATIQEAVDRIAAGGVITVEQGTYAETVTVATPDVTIRGADRNGTVIDGQGSRPYGMVAIADGVRVQNLTVRNHLFYGVLVTGLHDENGPGLPTRTATSRSTQASSRPCSGSRSTT